MKGKTVILIVILVTLFGIALAWFFLHTLPNNTDIQEQSSAFNTSLSTVHLFPNVLIDK